MGNAVENKMRAAIYNPYLDTLGGGEKYSITFAKVLASNGYKVDIFWKKENIKRKLEERFGVDLKDIKIVADVKRGDDYEVMFWVSDGSIPLLRARRNFLHFQFPFKDVNGRSLINKMKFFRIEKCICNSFFTKGYIDNEYGVESIVIYPPVDTEKFKPKIKENLILFVGRFSQLTQAKNQHVLVKVFRKLTKNMGESWKLVLAGGVEVGADEYLKTLSKLATNLNVDIVKSPTFTDLKNLYGRAKIFWSAVGYGSNLANEPQKAEHFGISLIEAMASGAVPIVYGGGGYREVVNDGVDGFLWRKEKDLIQKTKILLGDTKLLRDLSKAARKGALVYETGRFEAEVLELLEKK